MQSLAYQGNATQGEVRATCSVDDAISFQNSEDLKVSISPAFVIQMVKHDQSTLSPDGD